MCQLHQAVKSMDRLNSWVRSDSARLWPGQSPKDAIYFLKNEIIKEANEQGKAESSPVKVEAKCRKCYGTGWYVASYTGRKFDYCLACGSSGTAKLRFWETTFPSLGIVWHTPILRAPFSLKWLGEEYEQETDWRPNQEGKDLEIHEIAACLCIVEAFVTPRPRPTYRWNSWDEETLVDPFAYTLYLGKTGDTCSVCGIKNPVDSWYTVRRGMVTWLDNCCAVCRALYNPDGILAVFPTPHHLIEHEAIREWIVRRSLK